MLNSADTLGVADSFDRCERLCRTARETIDRARRTQSEAVEIRLRSKQIRADRQRRLSLRRREDGVSELAPPGAIPPGATPLGALPPSALPLDSAAPAVQLTALAGFVHARLDEEAASADLFHEVGCAAGEAPGSLGSPAGCRCRTPHRIDPSRCACRAPRLMYQEIADRRSIAHISEAAIREADHTAPAWPRNEMNALLDLQALAVAYELHRLWQEEWRP
ncbi:hypothetical protein ACFQ7F_08950 [Streptomyces sp. NPDC056486]|uniref:hypothetical protein n=1 Tax=Streptomyces sp. NPDC056486 TaxID=3345835 RepID=UPI0036887F22